MCVVVSVFTFCSNEQSSKPDRFAVFCFEKNKKEAEISPY